MIPAARDRVQFPANWLSAEFALRVSRTNAEVCPLCETAPQSTTHWCVETSMPEITVLAFLNLTRDLAHPLVPAVDKKFQPRFHYSSKKEISRGEPRLSRLARWDLPPWAQYRVLRR